MSDGPPKDTGNEMKNTDSAKGNEMSEGASSTPGSVDTTEKGTDATAEPQIVPEVVVGHGDERESEIGRASCRERV